MDALRSRSRPSTPAAAIGWRLDEAERAWLLQRFPPAYPDVLAEQVALKRAARPHEGLPEPCRGRIVGEIDDGVGVQCLVLEIEGATLRPDGAAFHVCWSLDRARGRRPVEGAGVIAWLGWSPVDPVPVTLLPARL